jgi:hypothetical protein
VDSGEPGRVHRRHNLMRTAIAVIAATAVLVAGCGDDDLTTTPGTSPPPPEPACLPNAPDDPAPDYVGLTAARAEERADDDGLQVRVVGQDGECFAVTDDLRPDRVNVELDDDVVIGAARY